MILDSLVNSSRYCGAHAGLKAAFDFLLKLDLNNIERKEVNIREKFINVSYVKCKGIEKSKAKLEAHKKYIDLHYLISGYEQIGWKPIEECKKIESEYDDNKDIIFFADEIEQLLTLKPGCFAIFFPEDAHAPLISENEVLKIIIKIKNEDNFN